MTVGTGRRRRFGPIKNDSVQTVEDDAEKVPSILWFQEIYENERVGMKGEG